jgi:hypothetical protein
VQGTLSTPQSILVATHAKQVAGRR